MYKTLSIMDLEKTAISSRRKRREFHSLFDRRECADHCRRLTWTRKRFSRRERQVNFTHFWISGSVRKVADHRFTKNKVSRGREKSISVAIDRQHCQDHCRRMDLEKEEIESMKIGVNFSYFRSTELLETFSTEDLE